MKDQKLGLEKIETQLEATHESIRETITVEVAPEVKGAVAAMQQVLVNRFVSSIEEVSKQLTAAMARLEPEILRSLLYHLCVMTNSGSNQTSDLRLRHYRIINQGSRKRVLNSEMMDLWWERAVALVNQEGEEWVLPGRVPMLDPGLEPGRVRVTDQDMDSSRVLAAGRVNGNGLLVK